MRITTRSGGWVALGLVALVAAAGCTTKESKPPELTGPSEMGLAVKVTATPDVLQIDGVSQSSVVIETRNAQGQLQGNVGFRAEILVGGQIADVGRLSSKTGSTGSDGRATITYTAPPGAPSGNSDSGNNVVTISVVPSGSDYSNAVPRTVDIRLVPLGVILPPANTPVARFVFSPTQPAEGQTVQFDASTSVDVVECSSSATSVDQCVTRTDTLADFTWDFGDGRRGSGVRTSHTYHTLGSYTVTLTVTNTRQVRASSSQFVTVAASADPSAAFTASPSTPAVGQSVFFNASGSKAAPGRGLIAYDWTFGDGGTGSGVTVSRRYDRLGSFTVTLTVTDDLGKTATASNTVTVGTAPQPVAVIAYSPASPAVNQLVNFDATQSTVPPGRTITAYEWAFGDGQTATGPRVDHRYNTAGDYTVILTVVDSSNNRNSANVRVTVK